MKIYVIYVKFSMILNAFHDNTKRVFFNLLPNPKNHFKSTNFEYFIKVPNINGV